jgi:predicted dehydrogenase
MKTLIPERGGRPSDVDDWIGMICEFGEGEHGEGGRGSGEGGSRRADFDEPKTSGSAGASPSQASPYQILRPPGLLGRAGVGATGVLESTKLATGRGEGHRGQDIVEINGTEGSIVYSTQRPLELQIGKRNDPDLHAVPVPAEFLVWPGCPRDPSQGDPLATFRYDQDFEFIDAILNHRPCRPSFKEGAMAQAVMDAADLSSRDRRWVDVPRVD